MSYRNVLDYGAVGDGSVADEAPAIQAALDVGPGTVWIPAGLYLLQTTLEIHSDTLLQCEAGAVIRRNANSINLLLNADRAVPGYGGNHDLVVIGGLWDLNRAAFPSSGNGMAFAHCDRVTVIGARITGVYDDHCIEYNAVRGGRIVDCDFTDFSRTRMSEMVQLDLMKGPGQFPLGGAYDNTPCYDTLVQGCRFAGNLTRGIGSHSSTTGVYHEVIRLIGNSFEDLTDEAIHALQWKDVVVEGNTVRNALVGWRWEACDSVVIGANINRAAIPSQNVGSSNVTELGAPPAGSLPPGIEDGDVLTWDSVNGWQPEPPATGSGSLGHSVVGYTVAGATSEQMTSRKVYAKQVTLAAPGLIASIGAYLSSDGADHVGGLVVALYEDVAGTPGKLLAASPMASVDLLLQNAAGTVTPAPRWVDRPLGYDAAAGTYWIAVMDPGASSNRSVIRKDGGGSDRTYVSGGSWVADWGRYTPTTTTDRYSIRAQVIA